MTAFRSLLVYLLVFAALAIFTATAQQPATFQYSIPNPGTAPQQKSYQGTSVAMDGNYVAVGAPEDQSDGNETGRVRIYDATSGALIYTIQDPNADPTGDQFGFSVALSGTRLVVGASYLYASENKGVYIYDLAGSTPTEPVAVLPNQSVNSFGWRVAIDGMRVVVGAPFDTVDGVNSSGRGFVFDLTGISPTIPVAVLANPTPKANDYFGYAIAISGPKIAVGASDDYTDGEFAGSVYLYDLTSTTPEIPLARLGDPELQMVGAHFGGAVALSGSRLAVGADDVPGSGQSAVYIYDLAGVIPLSPLYKLQNGGADFEAVVAISGDQIAVGVPRSSVLGYSGHALVYDLASATPTVPVLTLSNPTPSGDDYFGAAIAISPTRVVVGAPQDDTLAIDAGQAYLYDPLAATPNVPIATLPASTLATGNGFGETLALSGALLVAGSPGDATFAPSIGTVYIYDLASATPKVPIFTLPNPEVVAGESFGLAVAISGTTVVVAVRGGYGYSSDDGWAYVYELAGVNPTVPVATLRDPNPYYREMFGAHVAISGRRVAVGALASCRACIFDLDSATPTVPIATLNAPLQDLTSLAFSGNWVVIGSASKTSNDIPPPDYHGGAAVFDLASAVPTTPVLLLSNPSSMPYAHFGLSVGVVGSKLVVGAATGGGLDTETAYVYDLTGAKPRQPIGQLQRPAQMERYSFGRVTAVSGDRVAVGGGPQALIYNFASAMPFSPVETVIPSPSPKYYGSSTAAFAFSGTAIVTVGFHPVIPGRGAAFVFAAPDNATTTYSPVLESPASQSFQSTVVPVQFFLPEVALPGSVKLAFSGAASRTITLAVSQENAGDHTFSLLTSDLGAAAQVATVDGGTDLPDGLYTVTLSYQDALGNPTATCTSTAVIIDNTIPALQAPPGGFTPLFLTAAPGGTVALPDYLAQALVYHAASIAQDPPAGTPLMEGKVMVILTASAPGKADARLQFNVTVSTSGSAVLAMRGAEVPGAGTDPDVAAGSTWGALGLPSITQHGMQTGFLATVLPPAPLRAFTGIFLGPRSAPSLRLKSGDEVVDASGGRLSGITFGSFSQPVFASDDFAVRATVLGAAVTPASDSGIWASVSGRLWQVAREGETAPGAAGAKFKGFPSLVMPAADCVFFTGTLAAPPGHQNGLWIWTSESGARLALRTGDSLEVDGLTYTLLSFKALMPVTGSFGHGRYDSDELNVDVELNLSGGGSFFGRIGIEGNLGIAERTGAPDPGGLVPVKFSIPSSPGLDGNASVRVVFKLDAAHGVTATNNVAIVDGYTDAILARKGDVAPGAETATFRSFLDPVTGLGSGGGKITAFIATLAGAPMGRETGIWAKSAGGELALVACEGAVASETNGAKWDGFTCLSVVEGRGPIFIARLRHGAPGVTVANDRGLWAVDSTGELRLILRTGDILTGKKLQSFTIFSAVTGSPDQRRAWSTGDPFARIVYRATFTDGSTAILSTAIP